jgi:hypothetical protein
MDCRWLSIAQQLLGAELARRPPPDRAASTHRAQGCSLFCVVRAGAAGGARAPQGEGARAGGGEPAPAASEPSGGSGSVAGEAVNENDEELPRTFVHSYCAMDYGRMVDVASLRLHRLRRRLKDAVQNRRGPQVCAAPPPCKAAARAAATRALRPGQSLRSGQRRDHASPPRLHRKLSTRILLRCKGGAGHTLLQASLV